MDKDKRRQPSELTKRVILSRFVSGENSSEINGLINLINSHGYDTSSFYWVEEGVIKSLKDFEEILSTEYSFLSPEEAHEYLLLFQKKFNYK